MTDKEKEAIEKLLNGKKMDLISIIRTFKREGIENFVITKKETVETVLNLIEKQQAEIEKKDKIIDELAFVVSQMETGIKTIIIQEQEKYCEFIKSDEDCCWKTDKACTDCIKEYFKNKVNSSEQN